MNNLLTQYSLTEIFVFLFAFIAALKTTLVSIDWLWERIGKIFAKHHKEEDDQEWFLSEIKENKEQIKNLYELNAATEKNLNEIMNSIQLLLKSDKDDIKAWITEKHHFYCYEKRHIDDYSLDCIEKRYAHYQDEGGNSFVEDLMKDIRKLPKTSSLELKNK